MLKTLFRAALVLFVVGVVLVFILNRFFGLSFELGGTGRDPIISFHDEEAHWEAIEADRARADAVADPEPVAAEEQPSPSTVAAAIESVPPEAPLPAPWPGYRGPNRDGIYDQTPINSAWPSDGPPELWRQKIGGGYASMVVAQGLVFTIEQRRDQEVVAAYDLASGVQKWEHAWPALFTEAMGGPGPRATPLWNQGVLYALGALGHLRALDAANGELQWKTNILEDAGASNVPWGMSGSPLIADGNLIVFPGGRSGKSAIAYNPSDGSVVWTSQSDKTGYASPQLAELAGKRQVLFFSGTRIVGLDIADGSLLWEHPWATNNDINSAQPIQIDRDHLWLSSSYTHGAGLLRILADGDGFLVETIWDRNTMRNKFNSSVLYEGHIYGMDESIMACIDVRTGDRKWKGGRYGFGQMLLADDNIIVLTESGEVVLVKATPDGHEELAVFSALKGKTWNVPALANGILLVRNQTEMAAYDLRL